MLSLKYSFDFGNPVLRPTCQTDFIKKFEEIVAVRVQLFSFFSISRFSAFFLSCILKTLICYKFSKIFLATSSCNYCSCFCLKWISSMSFDFTDNFHIYITRIWLSVIQWQNFWLSIRLSTLYWTKFEGSRFGLKSVPIF